MDNMLRLAVCITDPLPLHSFLALWHERTHARASKQANAPVLTHVPVRADRAGAPARLLRAPGL